MDEAFDRQLEGGSRSQALLFLEDFNHPSRCWRNNTEGHKQSRRYLECTEDNFLAQVTEKPTRKGALLDLVLTNKEGLVRDVKVLLLFTRNILYNS